MAVQMYARIFDVDKYIVRIPLSGGKAGKGNAKTSNYQVVNKLTGMLVKQFKFKIGNWNSTREAESKAIICARFNAQNDIPYSSIHSMVQPK